VTGQRWWHEEPNDPEIAELLDGLLTRTARPRRTVRARYSWRAGTRRCAAILFADERILSSDDDAWDAWAREVVEAESYSRRLSRRVREGYEMKRRRPGTPGGNRAPFGFRREGRPSVMVIDEERMAIVRRVYELSASGMRDREVAARVGLKVMHIREVLTNPVYRGRLHRGEPTSTGPAIDPALWDRVQLVRGRFSRRFPGRQASPTRHYALGKLLVCAACGRRLIGDTGRYRHLEPCLAFRAARPESPPRSFPLVRVHGHSYAAEVYDRIVPAALAHVAANATVKSSVVTMLGEGAEVDSLTLARIQKDRNAALAAYLRDRDPAVLEAVMARLDIEEAEARAVAAPVDSQVALDYLANLPRLWEDAAPERRQQIAGALFEHIDVLGLKEATIHPSPEALAHGWRAAWGDNVLTGTYRGDYGRGERASASLTQQSLRFLMINRTPRESLPATARSA